jgi:hypothetical protein
MIYLILSSSLVYLLSQKSAAAEAKRAAAPTVTDEANDEGPSLM